MRRPTDAIIQPIDLAVALAEIDRGDGPRIIRRLHQTEPHLALFVETIAAELSHPTVDHLKRAEAAMDRVLTIVRALELGHDRLWRDVLPRP
jgi:hypothetical protein